MDQIMSRQLGWMAYDLRDIQRFGAAINGEPQPNTEAYRQYGQMAFTSAFQYNGAPAPSAGGTLTVELSQDQATAAAAWLLYDVRSSGIAQVFVNETYAGDLSQAPFRPGVADADWERRGLRLPPDLLVSGDNHIRLEFVGPIQLDRLQLEFAHAH
jgi:hypothetical protein